MSGMACHSRTVPIGSCRLCVAVEGRGVGEKYKFGNVKMEQSIVQMLKPYLSICTNRIQVVQLGRKKTNLVQECADLENWYRENMKHCKYAMANL